MYFQVFDNLTRHSDKSYLIGLSSHIRNIQIIRIPMLSIIVCWYRKRPNIDVIGTILDIQLADVQMASS